MSNLEIEKYGPMPDFDPACCAACGHSCKELAALIEEGKAKRTDCVLCNQEVELYVDGEAVFMVPFVQNMFKKVFLSMAGELKGVTLGKELKLIIK